MTERVLGPTGSRRRYTRTSLLLMALLGLVFGVLIGGGGLAGAASPKPDLSNYSQCSDEPGAKTECGGGWLNGILNAGGSQYAENDVTAQRFVIDIPANNGSSTHNFTLKYLWNKANNHAYDSLVQWNNTITGVTAATAGTPPPPTAAQALCTGITGTCPATSGNFNGGDGTDQYAIPQSDCTTAGTNGGSAGFGAGVTSRDMVVFGPVGTEITNITKPVNDSPTCSLSADQFETLTVEFSVPALPARVMFAFGGHLAGGTNRTGCWGDTGEDVNGASNINGGPYHIKLLTIDGASVGNQDNQIMSSAIAPLTSSSLSSSPHGTANTTWSATLHDHASVTGSAPTGTVTFKLYGPFTSAPGTTSCVDPPTTGANLIWTSSPIDITTGTSSNSGNTWTVSSGNAAVTIGSAGTYGAGIYQWVVSYSGDFNNSPSGPTSCGVTEEQATVTAATNATATPAEP
jgi:hypothetical protein